MAKKPEKSDRDPDIPSGYMTTSELAEKLGLSREYVSRMISAKRLQPSLIVGRWRLWDRQSLALFTDRPPRGRPTKS